MAMATSRFSAEKKLLFSEEDLELVAMIKRQVKHSHNQTVFMKDLLKYIRDYNGSNTRESSERRGN
jgi:hypothetical protein